jgi:hypothetical protein
VVVVKLPRAVTDWSVSKPAVEQFVPFARQTATPFTNIAVEVTVVAESTLALSVAPVAFPKDKIPIAALFEFNEVPVAEVNESNPVAARFVAVVFWSDVVPVAVIFDALNPPKN